ncbi:flagellar filament capping protein FliD [Helicobacter mesocricetorum]|uniref:flagellar filament capping protein FliD n=1 Tax=Helicobacter mesocricetorum TaxID=87012 RepID=UPI000CF191C3|nr:flagellar filament capping protein FliD [Helicobacter mesocricetorum]
MALGATSSLGIGSGILSWDNINEFKNNDVKNLINPITKKIENNVERQTELAKLITNMTSLNTQAKNLSDLSTYQKRSTTIEGSGVKATAGSGLAVQDIKINVSQLAQNDVNQVGLKFESRDSVFSNKNTSLNFYHDGTNYNINIKANMTLAEVGQAITDATDGKVLGIIMKTGGDNPYQLMIQSKDSGADKKIYFGSTLVGSALPGGKIDNNTNGTFEVDIAGQKLTIQAKDIQTNFGNTAEQNAQAFLNAINQKLQEPTNSILKGLVDSGQVTIGLNKDGKGLMLNDSKGGKISVEVKDMKFQAAQGTTSTDTDLGFSTKTTQTLNQVTAARGVSNTATLSGTFSINGTSFDLANVSSQTGNTNAEKVAALINTQTATTNVSAKVENGRLILNHQKDEDITLSSNNNVLDSIGLNAGVYTTSKNFLDDMKITNIQQAQNAKLTYNGINIERDKNTIDDIVSGLSLELTNVTKPNEEVTVRIARDNSGISDEVKKFVESYNEMFNKLTELTKYDQDTKVAGVFNGNSDITGIVRRLNSIITSIDTNGNNLIKFGVFLNDDGTLKFEKEKFDTEFKKDPDAAIAFFRSSTTSINGENRETDGVFTKIRKTIDGLITNEKVNGREKKGTLKLLETSLNDDKKRLETEKTNTQKRIDERYETMAQRWSLYDQMIAKLNQQQQQISQIIAMATKG